MDPSVKRAEVKEVVRSCEQCQSIDPAPALHEEGSLSVDKSWKRLSVDVTHYHGISYLTMVDCGPERLAIWMELKRETTQCIVLQL